MIFTSIGFFLFFAVTIIIYYALPHKLRWVWLLMSGIFFYMYNDPAYIAAPVLIILVTYLAGIGIEKARSPKQANQYYLSAIIVNVGVLVFFKYINFFISSIFDLVNFTESNIFHSATTLRHPVFLNILAPLGISYITFQAIGYLIELKRGNHAAERNLGHFSTYLLFFPKTIAGPIERAHHFLPQLKQIIKFDVHNINTGFTLILWGLFKKLVIADRLYLYTSAVLDHPGNQSGITLIAASFLYIFEMYADFSGYTDLARGMAKVLGFDLMPNFNRPLFARSVSEFWRKWHISLSSWFADYFYTPITIATRSWGKWSVVFAFFLTFIVLGFWHGANWNFVIFGALQGVILTAEFFTRKVRKNIRKKIPAGLNKAAGIVFTFAYFGFSLIFFRAATVSDAFVIISGIFTHHGSLWILKEDPSVFAYSIIGVSILVFLGVKHEYYKGNFSFLNNKHWLIRDLSYAALIIIILLIGVFDGGQFIYHQF